MSKSTSQAKLTIKNAQFFAYHGAKAEEQQLGGKFQVDLELSYDATKAIVSDDVNAVVNYEEAMFCIDEVMNSEPYNLLETVASEILNMCFERLPMMQSATVRVRKLSVPVGHFVESVEVEQSITRLLS